MSEGSTTRTITVADVSEGPGGDGTAPGTSVSLPVVELLTGRGFVTGKSGSGKSILEGTPVHTESGRKPIEAVEEGDRVLSLNRHTFEQEFREVQATIQHTDDRLLRVTLEDGTELVGTEDHSFLTVDGMEVVPVRGDELESGTWMPLARELPSTASTTEVDLADYVDDRANNLVVDGGVIQSGPRTDDRHLTLDFETGKEVGLYLAEGSFDSHLTIQIPNVDDDVKAFLGSRGYNVHDRSCNKGFRPLARFFETEFGRSAAEKSIPNWAFDTPEPFRAGLLSGYIDGDGTVGDSTVTATSKSESLVDGLRELFRGFGVSTTVREKSTLYEGETRRYRRITVDSFCLDRLRDVLELSVESKAESLDTLCRDRVDDDQYDSKDMIPNFGPVLDAAARRTGWTTRDSDGRGASVHHLTRQQMAGRETYNRIVEGLGIGGRARAFGESDIQWKRVAEVEELDAERAVYDLDVACNDNFVANGVFVHNSNSASVVAERLLDDGFPLLVVDVEGEYYGLKEEYELLHAGADEECDIQVRPEHAGKLASLALEQNVPIILDVSGYLDEEVADELVFETARQLFVKEKKLKQPFLLLVEEVHEYIPEGGGTTEAGRMLVKIGKRGRKHGLGLLGISQRPANVKKDYITQCDWLCWHRLTWDNDTQVVRRIIDREHAEAVEDLDDGEAFLMTDWSESIRRVQFHRKRTFDAGATPGLDDFERPELKSVDDDLVSQLRSITDEQERRESKLAELRQELERKEAKIEQLEAELSEARDLERMADRFSQALLDRSQAPYRGGTDETRPRDDGPNAPPTDDASTGVDDETSGVSESDHPTITATGDWPTVGADESASTDESTEPTGSTAGDRADETDDQSPGRHDDPCEAAEPSQQPVTVESAAGRDGQTADSAAGDPARMPLGTREALVADLGDRIEALPQTVTAMLRHVRREGPVAPVEAHVEAGGNADREIAYSRMRRLRRAGLVEHVGRGEYAYALPALVRAEYDDRLHESDLADVVQAVEDGFVDDPVHGWTLREVEAASTPDAAVTDPDVEIVASADDDALAPAFREDDAEYVDEGEIVADDEDAGRDSAGADGSASSGGRPGEAVAAEGQSDAGGDPRDGRDAEFID
ncbi:MAG: LAGLIDADG family homing endonuclease [Haloferacaceae archaeon]